jgi:hypothetical protein
MDFEYGWDAEVEQRPPQQYPTITPPPFTPSRPIVPPDRRMPPVRPDMYYESIRRCRNRLSYIWPTWGGPGFWSYVIRVSRRSVSGYRWSRRRGWIYFDMDINQIAYFQCY